MAGITVQLPDGPAQLLFHYFEEEIPFTPTLSTDLFTAGHVRTTQALIRRADGDQWMRLATGTTWCSPKDNFCKETGRRIALTRAIKALPREIRQGIWQAYFEGTRAYWTPLSAKKEQAARAAVDTPHV